MAFRRLGRISSKLVPRGMTCPILRGPLAGSKWIAGAAAGGGKGLSIVFNASEPERLAMAKRLAPAEGICFDIGANVGLYTLLFARYSKHVFAFEPLPRNIGYLTRVLEVNKVGNATIVPCAMSDSTGWLLFQEADSCAEGKIESSGEQPVAVISCDDFVSIYRVVPSLLKIDVEGAEVSVLRGAERLLSNHKPTLLLSTHGEDIRYGCLEFLKELNYDQIVPLDDNDVEKAFEFAIIGVASKNT